MDIVVDANILFAIMIKEGITERMLLSDVLHLYAPEYIFVEFKEHEKEILQITKRSPSEFLKLIELLERKIELVPISEFNRSLKEADSLLDDKDDAAYLAVCLAKMMPLWSNDNGFKEQRKVVVYTTQDLIRIFGLD
jgi:predicted nucleic acid-binding protein